MGEKIFFQPISGRALTPGNVLGLGSENKIRICKKNVDTFCFPLFSVGSSLFTFFYS